MSALRLYRARAGDRTLAWTVEAWRRLGLGPALLHGGGRAVSVALRLVEYVDSAAPDHPGRVDERRAAAIVGEPGAVSPPW